MRKLIPVIIILAIGGGVFALFFAFGNTKDAQVGLGLKRNDSTYVYCSMGAFIVEQAIEENQSPALFPSIRLFNDDGLFVEVNNVMPLMAVVSDNYQLHPYAENKFEGYLTTDDKRIQRQVQNKNTDRIGEQVQLNQLTGTRLADGKQMNISWEFNPSTGEWKAIENCIVKSFWIETSVQPGEVVTSSKDFVVVNLADLTAFFNPKLRFEFDADEAMVYLIY